MKFVQATLLFLLAILPVSMRADDVKPPSYPTPGVDRELTNGKTAKEFFAARAADSVCRSAWVELKSAYQAEKDKLEAMTKAHEGRNELDSQEIALENSRYKLLLKTEECGPCATDEVKTVRAETAGKAVYWYVSDGSYLVEAADEAQRKKKVQRLRQLLLTVPTKKFRLRSVIDYVLVDNATGKLLDDARVIDHSPYYVFTSVGKPVLGAVLAGDFYMKGVYETSNKQPAEFIIKTEIVPRPKGFSPPVNDYVSLSGANYLTHHEVVPAGLGMTYLTSDGYLRIWTATSYGSDLEIPEIGRAMMRRGHLDTLLQFVELLEQSEAK